MKSLIINKYLHLYTYLVGSYANMLGINLHKLSQGILDTSRNRHCQHTHTHTHFQHGVLITVAEYANLY